MQTRHERSARFAASRLPIAVTWLTCALAAGCTSDHDRLAKVEGVGGGGGEGGGATATAGTGGGGGAVTSGPVVEPAGPTRLTLVNGIADADAVAFCLVPYPAGPSGQAPWPSDAGLPFAGVARVQTLTELAAAGDDIEIRAFGGDLSGVAGQSCAQLLDATPPGVVAASLGVLPASVFDSERSVLLVSSGCLGAAEHVDANQAQICGPLYAPETPTATLVAGFMSRIGGGDKLALQFVHAVAGLAEAQVRLRSALDEATSFLVVAEGWSFGAIAPQPPYANVDEQVLGPIEATQLELFVQSTSVPASVTPAAEALAHGALTGDEVVARGGVVFVGVGAAPGIPPGAWWHPLTFSALLAEP